MSGCLADPKNPENYEMSLVDTKTPNVIWYIAQDPKNAKICLTPTFMETLNFAFVWHSFSLGN